MNLLYLVVGVAILVLVIIDLLWTTLWVDGGSGPISKYLTNGTWRALRRVGSRQSRLLSLAGPIILFLTLLVWVGLLWGGWTIVFGASESSLLPARDDVPVTWTGRVFYVGYTMFTMGNGDFYPPVGVWQVISGLTTASGMLFVTLGVSYILSVLGAVSNKRSFASSVSGMGQDGEDVVTSTWDGTDLSGLEPRLNSLASQLDSLAVQHKSYPILHYYHSAQPQEASAISAAILDETLTLVRYGVDPDIRPSPILVKNARSASENYIETLRESFAHKADETPRQPDIDRLREVGIPTVSDSEFAESVDKLSTRRRSLLGIVYGDMWHWPPVENE
jgi:hypothetical protein